MTPGGFGVGATRLGCSSRIGPLRPKPLQAQISLTLAVYALLVPSWHTVLPQPYPTPRFLAHPGRLPSALVPRHYHGTATALLPWGAVPMGAVPWQ